MCASNDKIASLVHHDSHKQSVPKLSITSSSFRLSSLTPACASRVSNLCSSLCVDFYALVNKLDTTKGSSGTLKSLELTQMFPRSLFSSSLLKDAISKSDLTIAVLHTNARKTCDKWF
ncbi:hypothetical protein ADUPG1_003863, partial [Aduncisulcus paluster]